MEEPTIAPLKLDFGCGKNKREGFTGVDVIAFDGVDVVLNAGTDPWPWADDSVDEAHASHFLEHLTGSERIHFVNELYRVCKLGAKTTIITPHWASCRAYGDLTHQWPPVSEFWFYYLSPDWRKVNAPHNNFYTCNFECVWGYAMRPDVQSRNQEFQAFAMANYKEAIADMQATLTKRN
jgi:hypothetical protein